MMDGEGSSRKLRRKPYTIRKSRDRWSEEEHERFLDGLLLFGREWKKIEDFVRTKTVIQIRSHAQKYFLKVQKNGLMAHVPPPHPKRNHAYHHPRESSQDDKLPSMLFPSPSAGCFIPPCDSRDDKSTLIDYSSSESRLSGYVIPNFAAMYNLIAIMIDPETTDSFRVYMQKLKEMDPITAKTALVLVKNLTVNLSSPDFKLLNRWPLACDAKTRGTGESEGTVVAAAVNQICGAVPSQCAGFLPMP